MISDALIPLAIMTDNPASKMVRVSTPLIPQVQKLCELHRQGHTEALFRGLDEIISAIEGKTAIPLTPNESSILAEVVVRLEHLEFLALQPGAVGTTVVREDDNFNEALIQLTQRVNQLENAMDELSSVLVESLLPKLLENKGEDDSDNEIELIAEDTSDAEGETDNVIANSETESELNPNPLPPTLEYPLSQRQLSFRLGQPQSYYLKRQREKGKEYFEVWSQGLDPDGIAWTFDEPKRRRGKGNTKTLNFYPKI